MLLVDETLHNTGELLHTADGTAGSLYAADGIATSELVFGTLHDGDALILLFILVGLRFEGGWEGWVGWCVLGGGVE